MTITPVNASSGSVVIEMTQRNSALQSKSTMKRAHHTKVRTGCKTCKIRHIRCDEEKPACARCRSTGRQCDGYATSALLPLPATHWPPAKPSLTADMSLLLGRRDSRELRSHRFFMEVTGPSMAGSLNTDFWLNELPRVCQGDDAIWHALMSLSCAHEAYAPGVTSKPNDNVFALHHYNKAIKQLTKSPQKNDWWRVLVISALFTSICSLESRYNEALLHFKAGYNLLRDYDNPEALSRVSSRDVPVSVDTLRSVLIDFEVRTTMVGEAKVSELPSVLSNNHSYTVWARYVSPRCPPAFGKYLSPDNLRAAVRSAESLFMSLLFSSQQHATKLRLHYQKGDMDMLTQPKEGQEPLIWAYLELQNTMHLFKAELAARKKKGSWRRGETHLQQAYLSLCLMQTTNCFLLSHDPEKPDHDKRQHDLPRLCDQILNYANKIMSYEKKHGCIRSGGSIVNCTVLNPIATVAKCGFMYANRRRAIEVLRRPRLEGLCDTLAGASFSEAVLAREMAATRKYNRDPAIARISIDDFTARGWGAPTGDLRDDIHPMARVLNTGISFTGWRRARLELQTWHEWLSGSPSQSVELSW